MENEQKLEKEENRNVFTYFFKKYRNIENRENEKPILENQKSQKSFKSFDNLIENNIDFNEVTTTILEEIKNNFINRINDLLNKYKTNFEEYKKNISDYLEKSKYNLFKVFNIPINNEILLKYVIKNIFNRIKNLLEIYDILIDNIEDNFELLNKYLSQREIIESKNPSEKFLNYFVESINNSSIISKFNFEEIDPLNIFHNNYYKSYLNFLKEEKKQPSIKKFTIKMGENPGISNIISFIKDNY